jgi:hypothetical protein
MAYMGKGSGQSNSKFMDLKHFRIKEQLNKGLLRLVYLDADSMPADCFASPHTGSSFRHFRSIIMVKVHKHSMYYYFKECVKKCFCDEYHAQEECLAGLQQVGLVGWLVLVFVGGAG